MLSCFALYIYIVVVGEMSKESSPAREGSPEPEVTIKAKRQSNTPEAINPSDIVCSMCQGEVGEFRAYLEGLENPAEEINKIVPKDLAEVYFHSSMICYCVIV